VKVRPVSPVSPPCTLSEKHDSQEKESHQHPVEARTNDCTDEPTPVGTPVDPVDSPALLPAGLNNNAEDEDDDDEFEDCVSSLSEATPVPSGSPEDSPLHRADEWRDATDVCVHNRTENCVSCALEKSAINNNHKGNTGSAAYQESRLRETEKTDSKVEEEPEDCEKRCRHGVAGSCILCGDRRPFFAKLREKHEAQVRLLEKENELARRNGRTDPEATEPGRRCSRCQQRPLLPPNPPESPSRLRGRRKTEASVRDMAAVPESSESSEPKCETPVPHRVMPDGTAIYYWCDATDRPPDQADHGMFVRRIDWLFRRMSATNNRAELRAILSASFYVSATGNKTEHHLGTLSDRGLSCRQNATRPV